MPLELTSTRRRVPLNETTFVTQVPPYIQTYIGDMGVPMARPSRQTRVRRAATRLRRGINGMHETTFVTQVPPYVQTYIGEPEVEPVPPWRGTYLGARSYDARGEARELLGFGALDSQIATAELQRLLRAAGYCSVGPVDNLWGPNTEGALLEYIERGITPRAGTTSGSYGAADFSAQRRSNVVRIDSGLLTKLQRSAAGGTDQCPMQPIRTGVPRPGGGYEPSETIPYDSGDGGGMLSNPMVWLGIAAVVGVGYYAYTQSEGGSMMMAPPRL